MASSTLSAPEEPLLLLHRAELSSDETEFFNEKECLFAEGSKDDAAAAVDCFEGGFFYYSRRPASQLSVHDIPNASDSDGLNNSGYAHHMRLISYRESESVLFPSDDGGTAPGSPDLIESLKTRPQKTKKSSLSVRESLLAEAWERKRGLNMLNEEMANFKDRAMPELLGRSSSDCGRLNSANARGVCHERRKSRTRSLTDDDFEELRGCIDLGFRFDQSSIPDLGGTLPALEVYCAVAQTLQESPTYMPLNSPAKHDSPARSSSLSPGRSWRVSSPGDDPKDVKGRLRHWAQAVACDARLCC